MYVALLGYMLEPKADSRPTIWQVCEVAFKLKGQRNPVQNVFVSHTQVSRDYTVVPLCKDTPEMRTPRIRTLTMVPTR